MYLKWHLLIYSILLFDTQNTHCWDAESSFPTTGNQHSTPKVNLRIHMEPSECYNETIAEEYTNIESIRDKLNKCVEIRPTNVTKRHILVTGGAGFVGSHLVDSLMLEGHYVIVCDNFFTGRKDNINHWLGHTNFRLLEQDVIYPLTEQINKLDEIYHLASPASPVHYMADPIKTIKTNTLGTMNMLELASKTGAKLLLASTSEVYGDPEEHPQAETYWGNANPIGPRSCYDESKRLAESLVTAYHTHKNLSVAIARIFNTYGPRMDPNDGRVVSNFVSQALRNVPLTVYGQGNQTRSFQYVSDLVAGLRRLMSANVATPVNLGNPNEISILTLASRVREMVGLATSNNIIAYESLPLDDPHRRRPDIRKALKLLDWRPQVGLDDGLKRTVDYFRDELANQKAAVPKLTT